jgi:hypothetical protein
MATNDAAATANPDLAAKHDANRSREVTEVLLKELFSAVAAGENTSPVQHKLANVLSC